MYFPPATDVARYQRLIASPHTRTARCELWSEGTLLTSAAPYVDGEVKDDWQQVGIRRSLTLSVPPSPHWLDWFDLPTLEVRPYRGVKIGGETLEFPLGRFQLFTPDISRPSTGPISLSADDSWWRVVSADFTNPIMSRPGRVVDSIVYLVQTASMPPVTVTTLNATTAKSVLLDQTRMDAITDAAKSISVEVFLNRFGAPQITDVRVLEQPVAHALTGPGGTATGLAIKPDWAGVYNIVAASSTAADVQFPAQVASVGWPAHSANLAVIGFRVMKYSSPLLRTPEQAAKAAATILRRVSSLSKVYSYTCVPDASMDAGDSIFGATLTGVQAFQIQTITHPLKADGLQQITTVSTQLDPTEWHPVWHPPAVGPPPIRNIAAAFRADGVLSAVTPPRPVVTAPFTSVGSLSAVTALSPVVTAPFTGVGSFTATAVLAGPSALYPDVGVYPDLGALSTLGS